MENSIKAAPLVRQLASQNNVDLTQITGTGRGGFITKADYEAYTGVKAPVKIREERAPLNHATASADSAEIGGMKFSKGRGTLDHSTKEKLGIPKKYLNKDLHYRWINENDGRPERLREIGYEVVDAVTLSQDEKVSVRRRVGTNKDGSSRYDILVATPKEWYKERHEKAEETRRAKEEGMFKKPQDETGKPLGNEFYAKRGVDSGYRDRA